MKRRVIIGIALVVTVLVSVIWWFGRVDAVRQQADAAFAAGQWRSAIHKYTIVQQRDPNNSVVALRLVELAAIRGEWQTVDSASLAVLQQPISADQRDQTVLLLGWSALQRGNLDRADQWWRSVSANAQPQAQVLQVETALRRGDIISATNQLNNAATVSDQWRTLWLLRAAELTISDAPSTTLELLDQLKLPSVASALPPLDPTFVQQRSAALRAISSQPPDARRISLARLWRDEGLGNAAATMLQQVPADSALDSLAHEEWARIRWSQGDAPAALADLAATIERYPNVATLRRTQATIAASTGDRDLATIALQAAVEMDGKTPDNYGVVAALSLAQGDYDNAAAAYDAAIQTGVLTGTSALQAANFYINTPLRPCSSGLAYARRALNTDVDNQARRVVTQLLLQCGNPREALATFAPLSAEVNNDPQLLYLRGLIFWRLGFAGLGTNDLTRVADLAPNSAWRRDAERYIGEP